MLRRRRRAPGGFAAWSIDMQRIANTFRDGAQRPRARYALLRDQRGLSSLEYALLFVIVCIGALVVWHMLGRDMRCQLELAISHFYEALGGAPSSQPSACAGSGSGAGNGIYPP